MQAWFPMGKPICGPGSCVLPLACQFSEPGLSYICHCQMGQFPIPGYLGSGHLGAGHSALATLAFVFPLELSTSELHVC